MNDKKICFVISQIGAENSEIRSLADKIFRHIIQPVAASCGYESIRADQLPEPGIITSQILQHIATDNLVVADLTGRNPNVFYELAIRHAMRKPVILIMNRDEPIPFDVSIMRIVRFDERDLDSVEQAKVEIERQIRALETNPLPIDSPISMAIDLQSLRDSDNPLEKSNAEMVRMLQEMRAAILDVRERQREQAKTAEISFEMADRFVTLQNEMRGRGLAILGYLIGESSLAPDFIHAGDKERLKEAITFCSSAYDLLKKVGGPGEYMALNNLLVYNCVLGDISKRHYLLDSARRLRVAGEEHDVPNLLLTYCRTVLVFGSEADEIEEACSMVSALQSDPRLHSRQKKEALYLLDLCRQRQGQA